MQNPSKSWEKKYRVKDFKKDMRNGLGLERKKREGWKGHPLLKKRMFLL
jgi:hypothetical protein